MYPHVKLGEQHNVLLFLKVANIKSILIFYSDKRTIGRARLTALQPS